MHKYIINLVFVYICYQLANFLIANADRCTLRIGHNIILFYKS